MDHSQRDRDTYCKYGLYDTQVSLVIFGSSNYKWTAYIFFDTNTNDLHFEVGPSINDTAGEPTNDNLDEEDGDKDDCELIGDWMASGGKDYEFIDANSPIWDPRIYFLRIVNIRMQQILQEWIYRN
jgi:hypothetical protein